jgi:hypothetical protein
MHTDTPIHTVIFNSTQKLLSNLNFDFLGIQNGQII